MFRFKFGKNAAERNIHTEGTRIILARALAPLGAPPAVSDDYVSAVTAQSPSGWGMMGNDQWGDCVEADDAHFLMLRTANAGSIVIPTEQQTLDLYSAETGFNPADPNSDQGTSEWADCNFLASTGFLGHKADAVSFVDPTNVPNLKWTVQLFGGVKFGVALPNSALSQFDSGQPWTVLANDGGIAGGHDILGVKYDGTFIYCVTWGQLVAVDPSWILKYADEAHALLFFDWIKANGNAPNGLDLATLVADLQSVSMPISGTHSHRWHIKRRRRHARNAV